MGSGRARRWNRAVPGGRYVAVAGIAAVLGFGAWTATSERALPASEVVKGDAASSTTTTVPPTTSTVPPTTTTVPPSTTTVPPTTTTVRPAVTPKPVYDANGLPQVTASPGHGEIGTTVHVDGYGFTDPQWHDPGASLWLSGAGGDPGCWVYAEAEHTVRVTPDGRLHGDFVVPARGACRQSGVGEFGLRPGTYSIVYRCTPCTVGTFEVTGPTPPASAECTTVGFTPQSEDAASSIVATGLSCDDAEAFLRKLGPMVSPGGPASIELDGFRCVLTRYEDEPLPQGFYECARGAERITFVRS